MSKAVAILGSGPAGLLAARAAEEAGYKPVVYSRKVRSLPAGAQYLHEPVPGVNGSPDFIIEYAFVGSADVYAQKAYGDQFQKVSWSKFEVVREAPAWSMGKTYAALWERFQHAIVDCTITPELVREIVQNYDIVMSTIPRHILCEDDDHRFATRKHWLVPSWDGPKRRNLIIYDGTMRNLWHRCSSIQGMCWKEYGGELWGAREIVKPLGTNCTCFPEVLCLGRYGAWDKDKLATDAYKEAAVALQ